jgi:TatD DNase family protein
VTPLVDIGANLTHAAFAHDLEQVLARARAAGVGTIVVTGTSVADSLAAAHLADAHGLYATAGVHPHHARDCDHATIPALREIAAHPRVVAIGECGLDYNRNYSPHPDQERWFVAQLELGVELGKPLFLHSRDAHPRFAEILRSHKVTKAVAHCFTGEHLLALAREIPAERLLLETDAPYLTPRDMRPQPKARRNEPAFLPHVLRAVARALGRPAEEVAEQTARNARALFGLPQPA